MTRPDLFGAKLDAFLRTASHHLVATTALGHDLPDAANRVTLSDRRDAHGLPLPQVTHALGPNQTKLREAALAQGRAIMAAAGAYEVWTNPQADQHIMGGAIMGTDPTASVTNGYGQTHDVPNLVVLGSSLFPTGGAVNPTFTIHALTLRTAEHLLQHWGEVA
jgi:choline dehydrogenase-like flavoprotein